MSNIFHKTGCFYFQLPQFLVRDGILPKLSEAAMKLYTALLFHAQNKSKPKFSIKNSELIALTGLSTNSLKAARDALVRLQLVRLRRDLGGVYEYEIRTPPTVRKAAPVSDMAQPKSCKGKPLSALSREQYERYYRQRLEGREGAATRSGFMARCLFHPDRNPSLSIDVQHGIWHCFGCEKEGGLLKFEQLFSDCAVTEAIRAITQITGAKELSESQLLGEPEDSYSYVDEFGEVLFEVLRFAGKQFRMGRLGADGGWIPNIKGVRRVLYGLPEVLRSSHVIVCEGEKDVKSVRELGLQTSSGEMIAVTCNPGGAGKRKWKREYCDYLLGKKIAVFADMDELGIEHAENIVEHLGDQARLIAFPIGVKDVSDYLVSHSAEDLRALIGEDWFEQRATTPELQQELVTA